MARLLAHILEYELEAEKVHAFIIGEEISHFQMHLISRYPGTPRQYWNAHSDKWLQAPRGGEADIAALCENLRSRLNPHR